MGQGGEAGMVQISPVIPILSSLRRSGVIISSETTGRYKYVALHSGRQHYRLALPVLEGDETWSERGRRSFSLLISAMICS